MTIYAVVREYFMLKIVILIFVSDDPSHSNVNAQ